MSFERSSGVLLHPSSLPGKYGIGTLGKEAFKFIDSLIEAGQKLWQTYPLGPTGYGDSPYQCFSAFAGNPLLIDLETLLEEGYLHLNDLGENTFDDNLVDYGRVLNYKTPLLKKAYENFKASSNNLEKSKLNNFVKNNISWLDDYALFRAIKDFFGGKSWTEWDDDIKLREEKALNSYKKKLKDDIKFQYFIQFLFFKQWKKLKDYANRNYIQIIGDIPIFVAFDSSDAWANSDLFLFDKNRKPVSVAGVPPDYFSATGQLWGNPLYDWNKLEENHFEWWIERIKSNLEVSDIIRIDHFRGFSAYWSVPANEETAINGHWVKAPGKKLFQTIEDKLGYLPIIAEDLGLIDEEVEDLRDSFNFPGMKILQFAFGGEDSNYLPHSYSKNCVVYTGTHDNDTSAGWFNSADEKTKNHAIKYLNTKKESISWDLLKAAWASTAVISIAPLQDILNLGSEARINTPGKASGNWQWRFKDGDFNSNHISNLKRLTTLYDR